MRPPRAFLPVLLSLLSLVALAPPATVAAQSRDSTLVTHVRARLDSVTTQDLPVLATWCKLKNTTATRLAMCARVPKRIAAADSELTAFWPRVVATTPPPVTPPPVITPDSTPTTTPPPAPVPDTTPTQPPVVVPPAPAPSSAFIVPAGLGGGIAAVAELPRDTAGTPYPAMKQQVRLSLIANLQSALNSAQPGDEILLPPGATYTGDFMLPKHAGAGQATCSQWIVLRTDVPDSLLGAPGTRMTPSRAAALKLAKLQTPDNQQAIGSAWGVANVGCWRLVGLDVSPAPNATDVNGLVRFGDQNVTDSTTLAHHLVLDRSYVHGSPIPSPKNATTMLPGQVRRCLILNARWAVVVDSWAEFCRGGSGDTQTALSYLGGPIRLTNNTLSGGTEIVVLGGANSGVVGAVASDVTIHGNLITRPLADTVTFVKVLLETKCSDRTDVAGNILTGNWIDGQDGQAVNAKSVNQSSGPAYWCHSGNFTFRYNRVTKSDNGLKLAGIQEAPAQPAGPYTLYGNVIDSLCYRDRTGACGRAFTLLGNGGTLTDLTLAYNTVTPTAWGLIVWQDPILRVAIQSNALYCGGYGIKGQSVQTGTPTLTALATPYVWSNNALFGCASGYPSGTTYTASLAAALASGMGADTAAVTAATRNAAIAP